MTRHNARMSPQHWSWLLTCVSLLIAGLWGFRYLRRSKGSAAAALNQSCETCGHLWHHPGHVKVAPTNDADDGGIVICRVRGCDCFHTWYWEGRPVQYLADDPEVVALRQRFQDMPLEDSTAVVERSSRGSRLT